MLSSSLDTLFVSKTTSPNKLLHNDCVTLYQTTLVRHPKPVQIHIIVNVAYKLFRVRTPFRVVRWQIKIVRLLYYYQKLCSRGVIASGAAVPVHDKGLHILLR